MKWGIRRLLALFSCVAACVPTTVGTTLGENIETGSTAGSSSTGDGSAAMTAPPPTTGSSTIDIGDLGTSGTTGTTGSLGQSTSGSSSTTSEGTQMDTGRVDGSSDTSGTTESPDPCADGVHGPGESDLDCGGLCPPCPFGSLCVADNDCAEGGCVDGLCQPTVCNLDVDCTMLDHACAKGVCFNHNCVVQPKNEGLPCDDGNHCLIGDKCINGACTAKLMDCSGWTTECTLGKCNDNTGQCEPIPVDENESCDDHNPCTTAEACQAGECIDATDPDGVLFYEKFTNNTAGWQFGLEWEIGPAKASNGHDLGGPDPAVDHSSGNDNGVAGVVLGGNASTAMHDYLYLTSPVINTTMVPGPLVLSFWRWLNTDANPVMDNRVEVFDGMSWKLLDSGPIMTPITEQFWNQHSYDVTTYKNAAFRIRVGHKISVPMNVPKVSGWNIDDVVLAPIACTPP